uniref:Uncharacterized protein n=1 Tax=Plectus sambesii TaxID=2011161 RepID=A0A914WIQ1_9BILA
MFRLGIAWLLLIFTVVIVSSDYGDSKEVSSRMTQDGYRGRLLSFLDRNQASYKSVIAPTVSCNVPGCVPSITDRIQRLRAKLARYYNIK